MMTSELILILCRCAAPTQRPAAVPRLPSRSTTRTTRGAPRHIQVKVQLIINNSEKNFYIFNMKSSSLWLSDGEQRSSWTTRGTWRSWASWWPAGTRSRRPRGSSGARFLQQRYGDSLWQRPGKLAGKRYYLSSLSSLSSSSSSSSSSLGQNRPTAGKA